MPLEELDACCQEVASTIARNAPIAVRNASARSNDGMQSGMDKAIVIEEKLFAACFESYDQKEGMTAFPRKSARSRLS